MTTIHLKDIGGDWVYVPKLIVQSFEGHTPVSPKVGDEVTLNSVATIVCNGVRVVIEPKERAHGQA